MTPQAASRLKELLQSLQEHLPAGTDRQLQALLQAAVEEGERLELQRSQAEEKLAQAGRLAEFGLMAAAILHEMNQPLLGLKGFSALIGEALAKQQQEKITEWLDEIRNQVDRMHELQRQATSFLRGDGQQHSCQLTECLQRALRLFAQRMRRRQIATQVTLPDDLPELKISALHLTSLLVNLIGNAVDAMPQGGQLLVTAAASPTGDTVDIWVGDSGSGIPPGQRERIFEPFFTSKGDQGTGLGLYLSRRLAELHGGSLELADPGQLPGRFAASTVFLVRLPVVAPAPEQQARTAVSADDASAVPAATAINQRLLEHIRTLQVSQRVLVVDDEPVVQKVLSEYLASHNILCDVCNLAEEASERLADQNYAVLLVDKNLPGMSGLELLQRVKDTHPATEVIIITGYASTESALQSLAAGAYDYVPKPFPSLDHVGTKIKGALARHDFEVRIGSVIGFLSRTCQQMLSELDAGAQRDSLLALERALQEQDDCPGSALLVCGPNSMVNSVRQLGYQTSQVNDLEQLHDKLQRGEAQVVVFVEEETGPRGAEAVRTIHGANPDAAVLVVAREASLQSVVEAIGVGVGDYLVRPLEGRDFLAPRLERLIERQRRLNRYRRVIESLKRLNIDLQGIAGIKS
ncbi:MAG: hypothetical protein DRI34_05790 [Deltaproteobacteria bacterium]|nr:MAG: hypothetical protein DRI34_05790 [Deltaproteobacteria bacterium]